jgi:hypothetical protein
MGYYTRYEISATPEFTDEMEELLNDSVEDEVEFEDYQSTDDTKWYSHEEHMREFSKNYPEIVFHLTGEGEEAGDIWHKYFQNGKMQDCPAIITFDDFDPKKLK